MGIGKRNNDIFKLILVIYNNTIKKLLLSATIVILITIGISLNNTLNNNFLTEVTNIFEKIFSPLPNIFIYILLSMGLNIFLSQNLTIVLTFCLFAWIKPAVLLTSKMNQLTHSEYYLAAVAQGANNFHIIYKIMIPNTINLIKEIFFNIFVHFLNFEILLGFLIVPMTIGGIIKLQVNYLYFNYYNYLYGIIFILFLIYTPLLLIKSFDKIKIEYNYLDL